MYFHTTYLLLYSNYFTKAYDMTKERYENAQILKHSWRKYHLAPSCHFVLYFHVYRIIHYMCFSNLPVLPCDMFLTLISVSIIQLQTVSLGQNILLLSKYPFCCHCESRCFSIISTNTFLLLYFFLFTLIVQLMLYHFSYEHFKNCQIRSHFPQNWCKK